MAATSFLTENELKSLGLKSVGNDVCISRNAKFYGAGNISIGSHVRIDDFCILSGYITIGNYIHISAGTMLFGGDAGIQCENYSTISSRCAIYAVTDDYSGAAMANPMVPEQLRSVKESPVILQKHSLVGSGCTILPGVVLAEGTAVGAMSLVNRSTEAWGIYFGVPAQRQKDRQKLPLTL